MCTAKKESLGEYRQSECPAQSPKRRRQSSQSRLDASLTNAAALQTFSRAAPPDADRMRTAETSPADLSEVIRLLETLISWRGSFNTLKILSNYVCVCVYISYLLICVVSWLIGC